MVDRFEFPQMFKKFDLQKIEATIADALNKLSGDKYRVDVLKIDFGDRSTLTTNLYDTTEVHLKINREIDTDSEKKESG